MSAQRKPLVDAEKDIAHIIDSNLHWVIEGRYTDLLEMAELDAVWSWTGEKLRRTDASPDYTTFPAGYRMYNDLGEPESGTVI